MTKFSAISLLTIAMCASNAFGQYANELEDPDVPTSYSHVTAIDPVAVLPSQYLTLPSVFDQIPKKTHAVGLRPREKETAEVQALRQKAQSLVEGMANLIALQTVTQQENKSVQQNLVRVIDGQQVFVLPDGREVNTPPDPRRKYLGPGTQWRDLPQTVGTNYDLPLHYQGERVESGYRVKVFYFDAAAEDQICGVRAKKLFSTWIGSSPCHGEVWTDMDLNILRISEQMDLPRQAGLKSCTITVVYGWLRHGDLPARLVPAAMHMATLQQPGWIVVESSILFTRYQQFHASAKVVAINAEPKVQ